MWIQFKEFRACIQIKELSLGATTHLRATGQTESPTCKNLHDVLAGLSLSLSLAAANVCIKSKQSWRLHEMARRMLWIPRLTCGEGRVTDGTTDFRISGFQDVWVLNYTWSLQEGTCGCADSICLQSCVRWNDENSLWHFLSETTNQWIWLQCYSAEYVLVIIINNWRIVCIYRFR